MKKKLLLTGCLLIIGLSAIGCGKTSGKETDNSETPSTEKASETPIEKIDTSRISADFSTENNVSETFHSITYDIPAAWAKSREDKTSTQTFYFPPSGQVDGNTRSLILIQHKEVKDAHSDPLTNADDFAATSILAADSITETSSEEIMIGETPGKRLDYIQVIDDEDYNGTAVVFAAPNSIIAFTILAKGDLIDYNDDFEKIIDTIEIASLDFLDSDENVKHARNLLHEAKIGELKDFLQQYIDQSSPADTDNVYRILEIIAPVEAVADKLVLETDEFSNKSKVYYPGLTEISSDTYIIPYSTSGKFNIDVGFIGDNWIFMKKSILKYGDEENDTYTLSSDSGGTSNTRDVLDGGRVLEIGHTDIYLVESAKEIVSKPESEWAIRLYGDDDKTLDHTLTAVEKDALITFSTYYEAMSAFKELEKNH